MVYLAHFLLEELAGGMRGLGEGLRGRCATNEVGDPCRIRTCGPLLKRQVLCQLS